nr:uncharacterized protein LOC101253588 isoform X2 [Solanum lycopersicum]
MYICRFRPSNIDEPIEWEDVSSLAPSSYARKKNVFMKGAIHWVAYKKEDETHQRNSVLFYNVKTEDFSEMNFPSSIEVTVASNYLLGGEEFKVDISTTDQSIQLVVGSFLHDTGFDIWIMNKYGNPISWSKRSHISPFTIPRNTDYRLNECLPEQTWMDRLSNRQIDFDDKLDEPLGIRNGEAVWWKTKKGFLALHDAATRNIRYAPNIRHTQVEGLQLFPDPMFVAKYKESLVLLPEVHFQISTNPLSRPLPPLLDGLPTAVQKEISVLNQHNEKLVGVLHDTRSREIVVLCHGFKSSKDFNILVNLASAMEKESISAFRFNFPGNGESEGLFQYGNYCREVDDLHSVVKYFNGESRKVTTILGHREGGNVVLLYASMHHDVQTVINLSGCYNLKEGIAEHLGKDFEAAIKKYGYIDVKNVAGNSDYRVTEKSLMDLLATNMDEAYVQIDKNCRVLTVHGSADIISSEDALEFNKISNHKSHIIQGATHCYMLMSHQDELTTAVLSFIKEDQLQN